MRVQIRQIRAIIGIICRDALRERSLYTLFFAALLLLLAAMVMGKMAVGGGQRIIQNMGFWILGIWGPFIIMHFGAKSLKTDFENKVIYMIVSRPVSRAIYIIGRFFGTLAVMFIFFISLAICWSSLLYSWHISLSGAHIIMLVFIFAEWTLLTSVSLMLTAFTASFTHHFFVIGLYVMGHLSSDMLRYANVTEIEWLRHLFKFFYHAFPNLEALNFRKEALYGESIPLEALITGGGVLALWVITFLVAATLLWHQKKIK